MGTFAVGSIVCFFVGLAVRSMVRDKKNGKSIQCGGNCKNCGGHCRQPDKSILKRIGRFLFKMLF